jgi:hypothetical protein
MGKAEDWTEKYKDVQRLNAIEATRTIVEREIHDFPSEVGPPIVPVVLNKDGAHWIPSLNNCLGVAPK